MIRHHYGLRKIKTLILNYAQSLDWANLLYLLGNLLFHNQQTKIWIKRSVNKISSNEKESTFALFFHKYYLTIVSFWPI
ncbi:hypothetical protein QF028_005221 [Neobacillus sp. B4I6]|jgi:hypothetical protein